MITEDMLLEQPYGDGSDPVAAVKFDAGKPKHSLLPKSGLDAIAEVLEFGANKYGRDNWKQGDGMNYTRLYDALQRHLTAWLSGEDLDPESGLNHLAHAGCNIFFLLDQITADRGEDDR